MNIRSAFTGGTLTQHYGLSDGEKMSASGWLGFTYQLAAVLIATSIIMFSGPGAPTAATLPVNALITVVAAFGFFAGAKLLIKLADFGVQRIGSYVTQSALKFIVTLVLMLAFLAMIMSWPALFLFGLAKALPSLVGFAGWQSAIMSGFGVLSADTILGGLTGVSLLSGKREKVLK